MAKSIHKFSADAYGIYQHLHHGIGKIRPAKLLKTFKRRKHARKFAKR